jgi:hypothetical protein
MAAGSTYTPISTQTLGSGQTSVTFNSFSGYTDLVLAVNAGEAGSAGSSNAVSIRLNGDSGSNYSTTFMYGNGSTAASGRATRTTFAIGARMSTASPFKGNGIIHFQNYSNSTTYKTILSRGNDDEYVLTYVNLWRNTAAITSINLGTLESGGTFQSGSTFTLYGIAAA